MVRSQVLFFSEVKHGPLVRPHVLLVAGLRHCAEVIKLGVMARPILKVISLDLLLELTSGFNQCDILFDLQRGVVLLIDSLVGVSDLGSQVD